MANKVGIRMKQVAIALSRVLSGVAVLALALVYLLAPPKDGSLEGWLEFFGSLVVVALAIFAAFVSFQGWNKEAPHYFWSSTAFLLAVGVFAIVHGAFAVAKKGDPDAPVSALVSDDSPLFPNLSKTLHYNDGAWVIVFGSIITVTQLFRLFVEHKPEKR